MSQYIRTEDGKFAMMVVPQSSFYIEFDSVMQANQSTTPITRDVTDIPKATVYRVRVITEHSGQLIIYSGANPDITKNKEIGSMTVDAGIGAYLEIPLTARYIGCKFINGQESTGANKVEIQTALIAM